MTMRRALATAFTSVLILAGACGAPAAPPPLGAVYVEAPRQTSERVAPPLVTAQALATPRPPEPAAAKTTGAECAIDAPWIAQVGGKGAMSTLMRFDAMNRRGSFGPVSPITTYNDFTTIARTSEEKYEWPGPVPGERNPDVVILRNASGAVPGGYGAPVRLASGVLEHPPGPDIFPGRPRRFTLFVFPDRTWVRVDGPAMTARVRELFANPGVPPPLPSADSDVAWELCGPLDQNDVDLPYDRWTIDGDRVAVRLFASKQEGEIVYTFASAALASSAAAQQAMSCRPRRCDWVTSSAVEGSLVRYGVTVRTPPTSARTVLGIAEKTMPLPSAPAPNAPAAPGMPPSGVYQEFREVLADSCPTRSAGQPFPSDMTPLLMTHRDGKTFTNLHSNDPRAPGVMVRSMRYG